MNNPYTEEIEDEDKLVQLLVEALIKKGDDINRRMEVSYRSCLEVGDGHLKCVKVVLSFTMFLNEHFYRPRPPQKIYIYGLDEVTLCDP